VSAGAGAGFAQTGEVSEETRAQARQLYQQGRQLFDRDQPEQALETLGRSYALFPHWATSNGMALCQEKLGRPREALDLYERALAEGGEGLPADQRSQIEGRVGTLRRSLGLARVTVVSDPAGAQVFVDGAPMGTTPFSGNVGAGARTIGVDLAGYERADRSLTLAAGEQRNIDVILAVRQVEAPAAAGFLTVRSDPPGAAVRLDGAEVGRTPVEQAQAAAGEHVVRVDAGDGRVWEDRVRVDAGDTAHVDVEFGGGVSQVWFWTIAGTAAAATIGTVATGVYAWTLYDEFGGATDERREEIRPTAETMYDVADSLLGVAAATAVGALVLFFFTDFGEEPSASVTIRRPEEAVGDATAATWAPFRW
jgi:hypothetical protein